MRKIMIEDGTDVGNLKEMRESAETTLEQTTRALAHVSSAYYEFSPEGGAWEYDFLAEPDYNPAYFDGKDNPQDEIGYIRDALEEKRLMFKDFVKRLDAAIFDAEEESRWPSVEDSERLTKRDVL